MRVLAVTPLYPPVSRVGAWLATHQFMRHLAAGGHDVTAVAFRAAGRGWTHEGVQVLTGLRGRAHIQTLGADFDVVVSHHGDGGFGRDVARKSGRPSVQMVHGHIHRAPQSADLLVFNSEATRAACKDAGPSIVCRPPTARPDHQVGRVGHKLTLVNLTEAKGVRVVWQMAERLTAHSFLGVRGGYGEQTVPRTPNFEAVQTQTDMRRVWERTRILLMPSVYETWGMTGVEAMCSGIPVIAHPTGGLLESLGDGGIFVDRDDVDGWCDTVRRLDDPDEYAAASAAASARFAQLEPAMQADCERFTAALSDLCGVPV